MKILKIHFKNINSLRGEHFVDFTLSPLIDSQLFAITGPTGSGKSTILDVISLALFCRVPRLGKVSKKVITEGGAILTRNTTEAFASVVYECNKGIFRSTWSISTSRNNNLRDYEMELADVAENRILDLRKSDIPGKNEELISLNYDQFIKSMLLAQGEFAQFLKVNKSERGELLEKITGTGIYRKLGKKAFEKKTLYAKALEDLRIEESIYKDSLMQEEELVKSQKRDAELTKLLNKKEKLLGQMTDQLKLHQEVSQLKESLKKKEEDRQLKHKDLCAFKESEGVKLKQHEATSAFAESLEEWKRNLYNIETSAKKLEALLKDRNEEQLKRSDILEKVTNLVRSKVDPKNVKESLDQFQKRVQELDSHIEKKRQDYKNKKSELVARGESWGYLPSNSNPSEDLQKLQSFKTETDKELNQLKDKLKDLSLKDSEKESSLVEKKLNLLRQGQQLDIQLKKILANIKREINTLNQKSDLQAVLPDQIKKLKGEKDKIELSVKMLRLELENQKLRTSLEDKRANLKEGKPCPLCGSIDHPWSINVPKPDNALERKLKKDEDNLQAVITELTRTEEQFRILDKEKEELSKRIHNLQTEHEELKEKLKSECGEWLKKEPVDWELLINQKESQREFLKKFTELSQKANGIEKCLPVLLSMIKILGEGKQLALKRKDIFLGDDVNKTCGDLLESWLSVIHKLQSSNEQESQLLEEKKAIEHTQSKLQEELIPALKSKGFEGIEDAISNRLREKEYNQLNHKLSLLNEAFKTAEIELESLQKQFSNKSEKLTKIDLEDISEKIENLKTKLVEIRENYEEVRRNLKNHSENLQKVEDLKKRISEEEKIGRKWELLNQLIGDALGKRFNDFAQDLTLQQLLALANNRLKLLSDRYLVASPLPEEDDSLVAIDNHMGGQRRSVKTLSGGETFILSLSLALALSDLAASNVEINSLFIDEGFGTLDPETLDQTIDTLEKLQTESSKTIGIISHVEALKERIHTQIQLERNGQGYSSLKVV